MEKRSSLRKSIDAVVNAGDGTQSSRLSLVNQSIWQSTSKLVETLHDGMNDHSFRKHSNRMIHQRINEWWTLSNDVFKRYLKTFLFAQY